MRAGVWNGRSSGFSPHSGLTYELVRLSRQLSPQLPIRDPHPVSRRVAGCTKGLSDAAVLQIAGSRFRQFDDQIVVLEECEEHSVNEEPVVAHGHIIVVFG